MTAAAHPPFIGAKVALLQGGRLLTYLRDDRPGLPWPGHWDLPGGGREGAESPEDCVLRELEEEFGLRLTPARLLWSRRYGTGDSTAHFFGGEITLPEIAAIRFGDEGQHWRMMPVGDYLSHPLAIPHFQSRISDFLSARG